MFIRSTFLITALTLGALTGVEGVMAGETTSLQQKPVLNLTSALRIMDAARTYAAAHQWPCSIAIVDDGGWTLSTVRMDGSPVVAGTDLAQGKARTSALFKRPSDDLEKAINGGRAAAVTAGLVMMKGGQPIRREGEVIGAIGISADTPAHDDEIALAALSAVAP